MECKYYSVCGTTENCKGCKGFEALETTNNMKIIKINTEAAEKLENMIFYYDCHGIENMIEKRPNFVIDDFTEVLDILKTVLDI